MLEFSGMLSFLPPHPIFFFFLKKKEVLMTTALVLFHSAG